MLRTVLEWIWTMIVFAGMIGLVLFSCYLMFYGVIWVMTHLFEIMMFGLLCAMIVFIVAIVKYIWEVITDE